VVSVTYEQRVPVMHIPDSRHATRDGIMHFRVPENNTGGERRCANPPSNRH